LDLEPDILRQLRETFAVEFDEQSQIIIDGCLALEKGRLDPEQHRDTLQNIFRAVHNIKGAARGIDLLVVSDIAHHLESCFSALKQGKLHPDAGVIDVCLDTMDRMREATQAALKNEPPGFDVRQQNDRLDQVVQGLTAGAGEQNAAAAGEDTATGPVTDAGQAKDASVPAAAPVTVSGEAGRAGGDSIRVAMKKIEHVTSLSEELQVARAGIDEHFSSVRKLHGQTSQLARQWHGMQQKIRQLETERKLPEDLRRLLEDSHEAIAEVDGLAGRVTKMARSTSTQLGYVTKALQNDTRILRLVPVSLVLRPLVRTARDIARELGKEVEIEITGDEIEIDRSILEQLNNPLIHLLRNAIDHGIEDAAERSARDKPGAGRITIQVEKEGATVAIRVADDGAGIDAGQVAERAVGQGLLSRAEADGMQRGELLDLIFRPGFSTRRVVTDLSGRGVGLDVVRTGLKALRGSVSVSSGEGEGCTFVLRVPVTMTTEDGLLVRAGGQLFAIPVTAVDQIRVIGAGEVIEVEASQAIMAGDRPIPLRDLAGVLETGPQKPAHRDTFMCVVISKGWEAVAFLVDDVIGEREIVVKRLQSPLVAVRNVSGATHTGDGGMIVVLNPSDLVDSARRTGQGAQVLQQIRPEREAVRQHVLIVDDSITIRTLERNILESLGFQVTVAVDGKDGWEKVQSGDFDLIVTDIEMPGMSGLELTGLVKSSSQYGGIPVIIVTSRGDEDDRRRGFEVGADAYIVKGQFETRSLVESVRQLL